MGVPLGYLHGYGDAATRTARLGWIAMDVCIAVVVVISILLIAALVRGRSDRDRNVPGEGLKWIYIGVPVSTVFLIFLFVLSETTLHAVTRQRVTHLTVRVTAHQWWWEVRYDDGAPGDIFTTANEIHIPVGEPLTLELRSLDVIHSFWVPRLAGKMDVIPGQTNTMWLEADSAGIYDGQCGEYCGLQHAQMGFRVIAESRADFNGWRATQLKEATAPTDSVTAHGMHVFQQSCGACHTIRGTDAGGIFGPDLTHVMTRTRIAANIEPTTRGYLMGWISNPQTIKPGAKMPAIPLSADDLQSVVAYLETLQ